MNKISTTYLLIIPFYDLDPMNVVWHGNYVKYLEKARCDFLEKIGYTYTDMKKDDIAYPIAKLEVKYIKPVEFGQKVEIITTLEEYEPALIFKYEMIDFKTKQSLMKAKTMQMGINFKTKESIIQIPDKFRKKLEDYEK